jgi:hypothetical protein
VFECTASSGVHLRAEQIESINFTRIGTRLIEAENNVLSRRLPAAGSASIDYCGLLLDPGSHTAEYLDRRARIGAS